METGIAGVQLKTDMASMADKALNLVVFVALGSKSAIATVHYNLYSHFHGWDCIVYTHKDESEISRDDLLVKEIMSKCSVIRLPGLFWGDFQMTLAPELVQQYEHIAVLLDDVFAPTLGDTAVNVTKLLQHMRKHNMTSISPSVKGSTHPSTHPKLDQPCLLRVHHIETFFQIFTRELFICRHSYLSSSNRQGWCLELCLERQMCPLISRLAVDSSMISYHMGNVPDVASFVPESALVGVNLTGSTSRPTTVGTWDMCHELNCTSSLDLPSEILECNA